MKKYLKENASKVGVFLETAHPVKFSKDVEKSLGFIIDKPKLIEKLIEKDKKSIEIKNYNEFKNVLLKINQMNNLKAD